MSHQISCMGCNWAYHKSIMFRVVFIDRVDDGEYCGDCVANLFSETPEKIYKVESVV